MRRRDFLSFSAAAAFAGAAAAFPRLAFAQQASKVPHVAWLTIPLAPMQLEAFQQGLADNGYVVGKDVIIDAFTAPADADLPAHAAKVGAQGPAVIVVWGTAATLAAKAATSTIPIVFLSVADPIGAGLVRSLAQPGGNVTGFSILAPDVIGKQLAMLKEIVPTMTRFGVVAFRSDPTTPLYKPQIKAAAQPLDIQPLFIDFVEDQDYAGQIDQFVTAGVTAVFVPPFNELSAERDLLHDRYLKDKLTVLGSSGFGQPGLETPFSGVVTYGPNSAAMTRNLGAGMVAAILKGAKPNDLPVEQPTAFDSGVNLDMAKKISVTIPPDILAQATLVIDYDIRAPKAGAQ